MRLFSSLLAAWAAPALALALFVAGASPSVAQPTDTGSRAWATSELELHQGPGGKYAVTGTIADRSPILVDRCQKRWCQVRANGQAGWALLRKIGFGNSASHPWTLPPVQLIRQPGSVCFYEGQNYTGQSFCAEGGYTAHDLLLSGLDNRYASVKIVGDASVTLCRDREFASYCALITHDMPVLQRFLNKSVSSIRVW